MAASSVPAATKLFPSARARVLAGSSSTATGGVPPPCALRPTRGTKLAATAAMAARRLMERPRDVLPSISCAAANRTPWPDERLNLPAPRTSLLACLRRGTAEHTHLGTEKLVRERVAARVRELQFHVRPRPGELQPVELFRSRDHARALRAARRQRLHWSGKWPWEIGAIIRCGVVQRLEHLAQVPGLESPARGDNGSRQAHEAVRVQRHREIAEELRQALAGLRLHIVNAREAGLLELRVDRAVLLVAQPAEKEPDAAALLGRAALQKLRDRKLLRREQVLIGVGQVASDESLGGIRKQLRGVRALERRRILVLEVARSHLFGDVTHALVQPECLVLAVSLNHVLVPRDHVLELV